MLLRVPVAFCYGSFGQIYSPMKPWIPISRMGLSFSSVPANIRILSVHKKYGTKMGVSVVGILSITSDPMRVHQLVRTSVRLPIEYPT